jgi:hypothetical protein
VALPVLAPATALSSATARSNSVSATTAKSFGKTSHLALLVSTVLSPSAPFKAAWLARVTTARSLFK